MNEGYLPPLFVTRLIRRMRVEAVVCNAPSRQRAVKIAAQNLLCDAILIKHHRAIDHWWVIVWVAVYDRLQGYRFDGCPT